VLPVSVLSLSVSPPPLEVSVGAGVSLWVGVGVAEGLDAWVDTLEADVEDDEEVELLADEEVDDAEDAELLIQCLPVSS
jgi:hypothetical protein